MWPAIASSWRGPLPCLQPFERFPDSPGQQYNLPRRIGSLQGSEETRIHTIGSPGCEKAHSHSIRHSGEKAPALIRYTPSQTKKAHAIVTHTNTPLWTEKASSNPAGRNHKEAAREVAEAPLSLAFRCLTPASRDRSNRNTWAETSAPMNPRFASVS